MSLYEKIVNDRNETRKKSSPLTGTYQVIIGEIQRSMSPTIIDGVKTYSDSTVISILKSLKKNWEESLSHDKHNAVLINDIKLVESYLPVQLSEEDLKSILKNGSFEKLGDFMKHLKENYSGAYDGQKAKEVFTSNET